MSIINTNYHNLCRQVLKLDPSIRFAGISKLDGKIIAAEYREGLKPLLSINESEMSMIQSVIRMNIRRTLEEKLGKIMYSTTTYEKVKRATIPLFNNNKEIDRYDSYLMVSFEKESVVESVINNKILPLLNKIDNKSND